MPKDLEGKKVGVRAYSVTTGVWTRGIFINEYGLDSSKVTWVVDDEEHVTSLKLPPNVIHAPEGKSLQSMMAAGEIQAGFTGPAGVGRAGPPIGNWDMNAPTGGAAGTYPELLANVEQVEADWFRRTGIYPIHGLIVVKDEHIKRYPWLPRSLMNAFVTAKKPYLEGIKLGRGDSPEDKRYRSFFSLMGDPLPYGMAANRPSIEALVTYALAAEADPLASATRPGLRRHRRLTAFNSITRKSTQPCRPSSISIRTSSRPTPRSIRSIRSAARSPPGRPNGRPPMTICSERWTKPASPRRRSCIPRPPTATTTATSPMRSPRCLRASPACISIDVLAPDAVKTFDYWLGRGCTGMRLFTTGSTLPNQATWFADPKSYPFWEHAAAKNIPVCMQMKQEGIPLLRQIMDKFPKVTILLDHLSRTPFEDGPPYAGAADFLALAKYKQVYLKITPINVTPKTWGKGTPETFFGKVIDTFGAERIGWGSNFPNSIGTMKEILTAAQKAFSFAKSSDQDWIFGKTALALYPRLKD